MVGAHRASDGSRGGGVVTMRVRPALSRAIEAASVVSVEELIGVLADIARDDSLPPRDRSGAARDLLRLHGIDLSAPVPVTLPAQAMTEREVREHVIDAILADETALHLLRARLARPGALPPGDDRDDDPE